MLPLIHLTARGRPWLAFGFALRDRFRLSQRPGWTRAPIHSGLLHALQSDNDLSEIGEAACDAAMLSRFCPI